MARVDTHSRVVAWLKVALPLAALAILATLFMLADRIDPNDAIPYAEVDVEERARTPRMTEPTYAGLTSDGSALTLTADQARPATATTSAVATGMTLALDTPDGARTEVVAASAVIDDPARKVQLSGGVVATTSAGYRIVTDGVSANLDRSALESTGPVSATGPAGKITADRFSLHQADKAAGTYVLVFNGAVKLVYLPGSPASP